MDAMLITSLVLLLILVLLASGRGRPLHIFSLSTLVLFITDVVTLPMLSQSFFNPSLLTLIALVLVAIALERSRLLSEFANRATQGNQSWVVLKLSLLAGIFSAFLNNTAVVASLMGPLRQQQRMAASKLLLPLSYASIMGGMLTLIGTSTNLIINGFTEQAGLAGFALFDFFLIALPVFLCGVAVLAWVSVRLLPQRAVSPSGLNGGQYFFERRVAADSPLIGKTVEQNKLRHLQAFFLAELVRDGDSITPVKPDTRLRQGDILVFCGDADKQVLLEDIAGLENAGEHYQHQDAVQEVVISPSSILIGNTIRDSSFRAQFDAAVIAVRRGQQKLSGGVGNQPLQAGDSLLLACGSDFDKRAMNARDFIAVGQQREQQLLAWQPSALMLLAFIAVIGLSAAGIIPLLKSLLLLLAGYIAFGLVSIDEIRRRFPFELVMVMGGALTLAYAIDHSGLADILAGHCVALAGSAEPVWMLLLIFALTWLLTELITNAAAAAIVFPLALTVAEQLQLSPYPFITAVAFAASASFLSPYGYQTNLMVFSLGRYHLYDYLKAGLPLLLVYSAVSLTMIPLVFPFSGSP